MLSNLSFSDHQLRVDFYSRSGQSEALCSLCMVSMPISVSTVDVYHEHYLQSISKVNVFNYVTCTETTIYI